MFFHFETLYNTHMRTDRPRQAMPAARLAAYAASGVPAKSAAAGWSEIFKPRSRPLEKHGVEITDDGVRLIKKPRR
jgi:hypothetical protein